MASSQDSVPPLSQEEEEEDLDEEEEEEERPAPLPPPAREGGTLVEKAWNVQRRLEARTKRLGTGRYGRVIKMARKPEPEEFQRSSKIVAIGLLIVGLVGFGVFLLMELASGLLGVK